MGYLLVNEGKMKFLEHNTPDFIISEVSDFFDIVEVALNQ